MLFYVRSVDSVWGGGDGDGEETAGMGLTSDHLFNIASYREICQTRNIKIEVKLDAQQRHISASTSSLLGPFNNDRNFQRQITQNHCEGEQVKNCLCHFSSFAICQRVDEMKTFSDAARTTSTIWITSQDKLITLSLSFRRFFLPQILMKI